MCSGYLGNKHSPPNTFVKDKKRKSNKSCPYLHLGTTYCHISRSGMLALRSSLSCFPPALSAPVSPKTTAPGHSQAHSSLGAHTASVFLCRGDRMDPFLHRSQRSVSWGVSSLRPALITDWFRDELYLCWLCSPPARHSRESRSWASPSINVMLLHIFVKWTPDESMCGVTTDASLKSGLFNSNA